jgi:hypothetical protein
VVAVTPAGAVVTAGAVVEECGALVELVLAGFAGTAGYFGVAAGAGCAVAIPGMGCNAGVAMEGTATVTVEALGNAGA